jgi:hypothetical protein
MSRRNMILHTLRVATEPLSATAIAACIGGNISASNIYNFLVADIDLGRVCVEHYKPERGRAHRRFYLAGGAARPSAAPLAKPRPLQRPCLCCGRSFRSAGSMNRLCDGCRTRNVSPYAIAT